MLADANPAELKRLLDHESVGMQRSLFCTRYEECLDRAAELGWLSWTCEACALHARRHEMAARYAQEHHFHPSHSAEGALAFTV